MLVLYWVGLWNASLWGAISRRVALSAATLWLGWTLASADDPMQQPVHYDQPAQAVKQLLANLSRQTGVRLFAPSPLDAEIVLVSVHGIPLETLMDALAAVMDAQWVKQPNGSYHLLRTPKLARERRAQDDAKILAELKRDLERPETCALTEPLTEPIVRERLQAIQSLAQELVEQAPVGSPEWKQAIFKVAELLYPLDPNERLMARLTRQLNLRRLLEIPVGERRVFSNLPGRYLLPFGFPVQPLLEQYRREATTVYHLWTHPTYGIDPERVASWLPPDYHRRWELPQTPFTRLYLIVSRRDPDEFGLKAILADESLEHVVSSDSGLCSIFDGDALPWASLSAAPPNGAPPSPVRIEWSERTRQFIEAYRAFRRGKEATAFPEVLDPSKVEPLSTVPSDVLRTYARQRGKSIVALVPDDRAWWIIGHAQGQDSSLQEYLAEFGFRRDMEVEERAGVLLLKPRWSSYRWGQRLDRLAMSRWLHQVRQRGYINLEDRFALLKMYEPVKRDAAVFEVYQDMVLPEEEIPRVDWQIGFLNSLTSRQIDRLRAGEPLTLAQLSPAQRERLMRDIYYDDARLNLAYAETDDYSARAKMERLLDRVDLPHVFYPNGLPPNTVIRIAKHHPQGIIGFFTTNRAGIWGDFRDGITFPFEMLDLEGLSDESVKTDPDAYMQKVWECIERYKKKPMLLVERKVFCLEVVLASGQAVYLPTQYAPELAEYALRGEGRPVTLETLSEDLWKMFAAWWMKIQFLRDLRELLRDLWERDN
jgi:hypothetical protein